MAQRSDREILEGILKGNVRVHEGLLALVDRDRGLFVMPEGQYVDFKQSLDRKRAESAGELGRDILGFSNSEGGILLLGVTDSGKILGHAKIESRGVRNDLGPYIGTRIDYDVDEFFAGLAGEQKLVPYILVRRSVAAYPTLLRKDIELRSGLVGKVKYLQGSLFYREGDCTLVEPVGGDVESRARALRFTGAGPRTRSSFLLMEDKPRLRLYSHINDRFFGRDAELGEILGKFDDPRGKGVSLAGLGGIGKTELAIMVVLELHRRGRFQTIYSGSAKQSLLGPAGPQQADPAFTDLFSFLRDVMAWLGLDIPPDANSGELATACVKELSSLKKVLLFADNLETVEDRSLFKFLDERLPNNCWIITTGRVHRIRNFVYPKEVRELEPYDAAHLLRHELKRQGMGDIASADIKELEKMAKHLYCHPLAVRWFAWACRQDPSLWSKGPSELPMKELESFCVAHTLQNLPPEAQVVLGAIMAVKDQTEATVECLSQVSEVTGPALDQSLFELECAGLLSAKVSDENGLVTYVMTALAEQPARDLARQRGWEAKYVRNLKRYIGLSGQFFPADPLIRDLAEFDPRKLRDMTKEEIASFEGRVDRALPRCPAELKVLLTALKAECQRHEGNPISADELYQECAEHILSAGTAKGNERHAKILLEAATVAKSRGRFGPQVKRAISYLEEIQQTHFAPLRVLGMLAELHAMLGNRAEYEKYGERVRHLRNSQPGRFSLSQLSALDEALDRARAYLEQQATPS